MVKNFSSAISISTVVCLPSALLWQDARNRLVTSSYTRRSSASRFTAAAVGWIGGWALSFLRPFRGV